MKKFSKSPILFLGKKEDKNCQKAIDFIENNFQDYEIYLGQWGDPMPLEIKDWEGDYIISYLSRWIIPDDTLKRAKKAAINFHPASPDYPGIGCNNFALYDEAEFFGVTCHYMSPKVDTGPIIKIKKFPVFASDSVSSLLSRTYDFQLILFYEMLGKILRNEKLPLSTKKWTRKPYTRQELNELDNITKDMDAKEIKKRKRATYFEEWIEKGKQSS